VSVKHVGLILDHFEAKASLKLVAIILADHADSEGLCWPSYKKIAARANMTERSVARHVKELIDLGIVSKLRTGHLVKQGEKLLRISNAYRVNAHVIVNRKKLSPNNLLISAENVHLEEDKNEQTRWTGVSTKSSLNLQSNRKSSDSGDNSDSRDPVALDELFAQMLGERTE